MPSSPVARGAGLAAAVVAVHAVVVLIGWRAAWPLFVHPPQSFIPMAPSTAVAFLVLALALLGRLRWPENAEARGACSLAGWMVAGVALASLAFPARLDEFLGGGAGSFGAVRLGVMSPVTAGALFPLSLGVALYDRRKQYASAFATLSGLVGATIALGYAYGTPILYGSATIPVALPTGLSLLLLGSAIVAAAGPDVWPLKPLAGPSPRARLLRAFLPATAGLVVVIGLLNARLGDSSGANPVLVAAWLAVVGVPLVTLLVSRLARRLGAQLDDAYADRHRAEQRYRDIFEQTPAGVATTTPEGRVLICNPAFARIVGFESPDQLAGQSAMPLFWEPEDRDRVLAALRETGRLRNFELRLRRRDGKPVWVLANVTLHTGAADAPGAGAETRIESAMIDISERKALEQQLWQAQKLDALGGLAGGVAHDFNNLLTAIIGYAELMRMDLPDEDARAADLQEIDKACRRAAALTRQLLAFSRRQPFEPKPLRLDQSVVDMEKMLGRLLGPAVRLVVATDDGLAPIWADPSQIEQVVLNLAVNSGDAMPQGGTLTIETRNAHMDERYTTDQIDLPPGDYVLLTVTDTGSGMDRATIARIFEPFFTTKEKGKGTGLGLATVYGIVKQSRGHILVYSESGIGTTFKCYFPAADVAGQTVAPAAVAPAGVHGRETVLVAEDEPAILALIVSTLERHGYRVLPATDGEAAIRTAALHGGVIDLLLTDGVLSGMRVPELLRRLRAERPETKVLLMSGYSREAVFQQAIVEPSTPFLEKPFTGGQLAARVREVLDGSVSSETVHS